MLFLALACSTPAPAPPPTDILVVVLDTVRADALGPYGQTLPTSPQVDAVASAGVVFTDATAPSSWTWPSHAALFTGEPPWVSGAHAAQQDEGLELKADLLLVTPMDTALPTLAEKLGAAGYETNAFVANRLLAAPLGLTRGFTTVEHTPQDSEVVDKAIASLSNESPQFLFVNLLEAHSPYETTRAAWSKRHDLTTMEWSEPYRTEPSGISFHQGPGITPLLRGDTVLDEAANGVIRDLYLGEVLVMDQSLNRLLAAWTATHPNGAVVLTSDHGEYLGEHGLYGHSATVHPEVLDVPLVLWAPGVEGGQRIDTPVQLQDVFPTVLDLAGVEQDGWSLLDGIEEVPRPGPILAAAWPRVHLARDVGGVFTEGWRLYRDGDRSVMVGTNGTVVGDPELAELATQAIPMTLDGGGVELDDAETAALRALGYVD
ncbi:MAG: sulfatase [Proteobacteria bacterium]|nr:sulfatase [Pseudomonadota bacterium]